MAAAPRYVFLRFLAAGLCLSTLGCAGGLALHPPGWGPAETNPRPEIAALNSSRFAGDRAAPGAVQAAASDATAPAESPAPPSDGPAADRVLPAGAEADADDAGVAPPPVPIEADAAPEGVPLDFASALAMTTGQNPQVAFAQAQIQEAFAQLQGAQVMWLPTIRAGGNWNKHDGTIQDVRGDVFETSRAAAYGGLGARGIGAGSPSIPGLVVQFHLADAVFEPRIASDRAAARQQGASATVHDELLETALAYLALLEAAQQQAIADETLENAEKLVELTADFARTGQGAQADADRAAAALALRRAEAIRAEEALAVASARLAEQLHLDPAVPLLPVEPTIVPVELAPCETPATALVATALSNRPELAQSQALVSEAVQRLQREKNAPWLPSVLLWVNYGGMGGGLGDTIGNSGDRFDVDAVAYWEMRNLGFGEHAARAEAQALIEQARFRQVQAMDMVAREVVESLAQAQARRRQIAVAEQAVESATDAYRRSVDRIREGEGLPIEVLQSILALDEARRAYLRALVEYNEAQFRLHRALGWPIAV